MKKLAILLIIGIGLFATVSLGQKANQGRFSRCAHIYSNNGYYLVIQKDIVSDKTYVEAINQRFRYCTKCGDVQFVPPFPR